MTRYAVRTIARPAGEGWHLVPSATTGGAPSFWHRRTATALEWVAYDRIMRAWVHTVEPFAGTVTRTLFGDVPREWTIGADDAHCGTCGGTLETHRAEPDTLYCTLED